MMQIIEHKYSSHNFIIASLGMPVFFCCVVNNNKPAFLRGVIAVSDTIILIERM
jgi:hypothetical protein